MVLDKAVEIRIGGKKYKMRYNMKCVTLAERELFQGNLLVTVAQGRSGLPPNLSDMYIIFKYGIIGGQPELEGQEEALENLYFEAIGETNVLNVFQLGLEAIAKSGVMGDTTKKPQAAPAAPAAAPEDPSETQPN